MTDPESQPVIAGLGEVLWDVFPDEARFGGAPANYACSVASLSGRFQAVMISAVGDDERGRDARHELARRNVSTACVQTHAQPTGHVQVTLDESGSAEYEFAADSAWDHLQYAPELNNLAPRLQAVCFGTLGQRSPQSADTIQRFLDAMPDTCMKIFDINLRAPFFTDDVIRASLRRATVLKLNEDELPIVAKLTNITGSTEDMLSAISREWDLSTIAVTVGSDGALLLHDGKLVKSAGVPTEVRDTVGAGDSFTAALTIGLLLGHSPQDVSDRACEVAAWVCSQPGATPDMPDRLKFD